MKLYLRDDQFKVRSWWANLELDCYFKRNLDRDGLESWLNENNIALSEGFWDANCDEYLEFEKEQDATLFILRWA